MEERVSNTLVKSRSSFLEDVLSNRGRLRPLIIVNTLIRGKKMIEMYL